MNLSEYERVLDSLPFGALIWRADGHDPADLRLVYANAATEGEAGYDARRLVGGRLAEVMPGALDFWGPTYLRVIETGEPATEEAPFGDERHPYRVHRVRMSPIDDRTVLVVDQDVTDMKRAESAREDAIARLERTNRELQRFAGAVAHDLKSPIATLKGFAELLLNRGTLAEQETSFVETMQATSARALDMIDDLLDYARHTSTPGRRTVVELDVVLDWVVTTLDQEFHEVGARLVRAPLPAVLGNETALRHVFLNLVANSLRYRDPLRDLTIRIESRERGTDILVSVADSGIGVAPEHRERVFEPGVRVAPEDAHAQGTGFGLAVCRVVITNHGGEIWLDETEDGIGTVVHLTLPSAAVAEQRVAAALAGEGTTSSPVVSDDAAVTALTVDDDPAVLFLVREAAHRSGIRVVGEALDGNRALAFYDRFDPPPDVVVVDHRLADLDGLEVARRIRSRNGDQRIVLFTNHADATLSLDADNLPVDDCVTKPDVDQLMRVVRQLGTRRPDGTGAPANRERGEHPRWRSETSGGGFMPGPGGRAPR